MFMGPYEQGGPYSLSGIAGTRRFLERFWTLVNEYLEADEAPVSDLEAAAVKAAAHRVIKKVSKDLEVLGFNTAIAAMMGFVNELYKLKERHFAKSPSWQFAIESLVLLLAPLAPHIAEEMWNMLGHESSVHAANWPTWDESAVTDETVTLAVQVNGKVRGEVVVDKDISAEDAIAEAKQDENVAKHLAGKTITKEIYVSGRLVSIVVD